MTKASPNTIDLTFGDRILLLRNKKKLNQEQLAKQLNITPGELAKWEGDVKLPALDQAIKLAGILNVSLDFLACRIDQQIEPENLNRMEDIQNMGAKRKENTFWVIDALIRVDKMNKIHEK